MSSFSERQGHVPPKTIRYREGLPDWLRWPIVEIAHHLFSPEKLLQIVTGVVDPDPYDLESKKPKLNFSIKLPEISFATVKLLATPARVSSDDRLLRPFMRR